MIPLVVASERGIAQTIDVTACDGVVGPRCGIYLNEKNDLESSTIAHDSCVFEV